MVILALGVIIGMLVAITLVLVIGGNPSKEKLEEIRAGLGLSGKAKFLEPVSDKEKFNKANTVDDLLQQ